MQQLKRVIHQSPKKHQMVTGFFLEIRMYFFHKLRRKIATMTSKQVRPCIGTLGLLRKAVVPSNVHIFLMKTHPGKKVLICCLQSDRIGMKTRPEISMKTRQDWPIPEILFYKFQKLNWSLLRMASS